jgi:hypothetical protein
MLLRRFTDFILKGRLRSIGTAFVIAFIPVIGSISLLIAGLVTLRKNAFEGALVTLAASVPLVIQYALTPADEKTLFFIGMAALGLVGNALLWFFAVLLRRYNNWNLVLEVGLLIGMLGVVAAHILYPDIQGWWIKQLTDYLNTLKMQAISGIEEIQAQMVHSAKFITGFLAVSLILNILLQLLMARWWLVALFQPGGLHYELQHVRLSYIASGLFVVLVVLSFFKLGLVLDLLPVLFAIFAVAGLSLAHYLINLVRHVTWLWLGLVYLIIIILPEYSIVALAILALFDTWLDFRKRADRFLRH